MKCKQPQSRLYSCNLGSFLKYSSVCVLKVEDYLKIQVYSNIYA